MSEENDVSFKETLQRLIGVYVIIFFANKPNDERGGFVRSVEDDGKVVFWMEGEFYTHISFIDYVVIPNEDKAEGSPLSNALKKGSE